MRDHMSFYEQLQIKPMVVAGKKQAQNADLGHLTERTRNELVLISPKTEDPTFTQTFYIKKEL